MWICIACRENRRWEELGLRDFLGPDCLLLVEWPSKGARVLPPPDLALALSFADPGRVAQIRAHGALGVKWLGNLGNAPD